MTINKTDFFTKKRPWSKTKDELLSSYLPQYFAKILHTAKEVVYIDCFAGKGKFDDGSNGSPIIALGLRDDALKHCRLPNHKNIKAFFIELEHGNELKNNLTGFSDVFVLDGKYEDNILKCLANTENKNVFLYLDPYGIKALNFSLLSKIARTKNNSIEMLINLNTFGFIRAACSAMKIETSLDNDFLEDLEESNPTKLDTSEQSITLLDQIAGGNYWREIITKNKDQNGRCNGIQAEKEFFELYRQKLNKLFRYVLDLKVCVKDNGHPKYRLVHLTNHFDGCVLMAENMMNRAKIHIQEVLHKGNIGLFDEQLNTNGDFIYFEEVKNNVIDLFKQYNSEVRRNQFLADFFTKYGVICKIKDIQDALQSLYSAKKIDIRKEEKIQNNWVVSNRKFQTENMKQRIWLRYVG